MTTRQKRIAYFAGLAILLIVIVVCGFDIASQGQWVDEPIYPINQSPITPLDFK